MVVFFFEKKLIKKTKKEKTTIKSVHARKEKPAYFIFRTISNEAVIKIIARQPSKIDFKFFE